ncbi:carbohydrate ABC transporter permease [Brucella gallinifaecis]|uniref:carbohydrate ABC transporter permease n=1 Tax=Brucella gallinifaecis TaxID=215590 RepID=UPI00235E4BDD|nr:carbohydrate ABC transporter permease [Brucella gallinifaecis]
MMKQRSITPWLIIVPLIVFSIFPLVWMLMTSVKSYSDVYTFPPVYWPETFSLDFYRKVINETSTLTNMFNSIYVALCSTILSVVFGAMAGWIFARGRVRGGHFLMRSVMVAYFLPQILTVIPLFILLQKLGLTNSFTGIIIAHVALTFPFSTWLLTDYIRSIPVEIEEQARVDGAGDLTIFVKLILPLSWPGLATAAIFAFINSWNEFLYALIILGTGSKQLVTTGLYNMVGGENAQWGPMMAATTLTLIPTLLLFAFVQRRLVSGMTLGSVK